MLLLVLLLVFIAAIYIQLFSKQSVSASLKHSDDVKHLYFRHHVPC